MTERDETEASSAETDKQIDGEAGATSTEYGMMVGFVALALALAAGIFGTAISDFYTRLVPQIESLFGSI